jgi:hypothetical protein
MMTKRPKYPATAQEFEEQADQAEAKYLALILALTVPEMVGLSRAVSKALEHENALLKADTIHKMQYGIGNYKVWQNRGRT